MKPHPFENQIFGYYRENQEKIKEAIQFLEQNGYIVIDRKNYKKGN